MSEYWNTRWDAMREAMKTHPMDEFRSAESGDLSLYIVKQSFGAGGSGALVAFVMGGVGLDYELCEDSLVGNPSPVYEYVGIKMTADSCQHAVAASSVAHSLPDAVRVLEVGAGYGPFAYALSKRVSLTCYTFVDFEPSLTVQRYFVGEALPELDADFVTPDVFEPEAGAYDLAVAMHCLGEMSVDEARCYLKAFTKAVKPGGHLYLISWAHDALRGPRKQECSRLADYAPMLEGNWRFVFRRPWPEIFDANPAEEWLLERV